MRSFQFAVLGLFAGTAIVTASVPGLTYTPAPPNEVTSGGLTLKAVASAANGWVLPGGTFAFILKYKTGATPVTSATVSTILHSASVFVGSTPAPASGDGSAGAPLTYNLGPLTANTSGSIVIEARAKDLNEDAEVVWKNISADVTLTVVGQSPVSGRTHGPKVTTLESARYGDRPFPVVMVDYQDIKHCAGGAPTENVDCDGTADHNATALDAAVNSRTSGRSIWQLYQDLSFGQLFPDPTVRPAPGAANTPFVGVGLLRFSTLEPNGTCSGATKAGPDSDPSVSGTSVVGGVDGTPLYPNRIENGWYVLPGTEAYYGSDSNGTYGAINPVAPTIDDGCGPTGKIVYDAASLADPDLDYNDFDTDKDGVVDFFNLVFPGVGGNTLDITPTAVNNIWPHSSNLEYYFTDENGLKGYVSKDQFRNQYDQLMYYTDATYKTLTTTATAFPAYVRVGPYNVNPETAIDRVSVIAHEYGHSLGLPDFYSNSFDAYGSWELMAADHFQFMTVFSRQDLGWVVPRTLQNGDTTLRESKYDTGEITWRRPDGTLYTLTGEGIHNADVYRVALPPRILIDSVPSGTHAWHSGAGSDFGCPPQGGHNLDLFLPDMAQTGNATAVTLTFQSLYQIEWDWDYAFVMVSDDNGETWTTLPSANGATIQNSYNPNHAGCFDQNDNGITGVYAGGGNNLANPNRAQGLYPFGPFIQDQYDLTAYKGKSIILRFGYFTDPAAVFRGWFIDDVKITADATTLYSSDFESGDERGRLFPDGWTRVSTAEGSPADHAYYIELRDRISNDFNGKGQSERGPPTWQGGVSMIYTDESYGYGNTGVDNHPAQTPVDSRPQPGNSSPNLNDAAFTLARPEFNGCTHIDNYEDPDGPGGDWKLPNNLKFTVTALSGLVSQEAIPAVPATATINAEVNPVCDFDLLAPALSIAAGYEDPDTDGAYDLAWSQPPASVGPDLLQEATVFETLVSDDAEGGLGQWTVGGDGTFAPMWTTSNSKPQHAPDTAFWTNVGEQSTFGSGTLTYRNPIVIPAGTEATLGFDDWFFNEDAGCGDPPAEPDLPPDAGFVEVSADGSSWEVVYTNTRSMGAAPDAGATAFTDEDLTRKTIDLSNYAGRTIRLRFRFFQSTCDYFAFVTYGWYVDNIELTVNNFTDLLTTPDHAASVSGRTNGTYYYRVNTRYPTVAGTTIASGWSNVVSTIVDIQLPPVAIASAPASVLEGTDATLDGSASNDPNGDPITFAWSQTPQAGEPAVALAGADTAIATFTAPTVCADAVLHFNLSVSNAGGADNAAVSVIVDNVNHPPVAHAGADFSVHAGQDVMLSGQAEEEDCEALTYSWSQVNGPVVSLTDADTTTPHFTAPTVTEDTPLRFRFTVTDPDGASDSEDILVTVAVKATGPDIGNNGVGGLPPISLLMLGLFGLGRRYLTRRRVN